MKLIGTIRDKKRYRQHDKQRPQLLVFDFTMKEAIHHGNTKHNHTDDKDEEPRTEQPMPRTSCCAIHAPSTFHEESIKPTQTYLPAKLAESNE